MALYVQDPNAVLDYVFDWSGWLAASETISTSTVTVGTGLTENSESNTTTKATVWLSGGTAGTTYSVTNKIVTNQGRTDERTIQIRVENR